METLIKSGYEALRVLYKQVSEQFAVYIFQSFINNVSTYFVTSFQVSTGNFFIKREKDKRKTITQFHIKESVAAESLDTKI